MKTSLLETSRVGGPPPAEGSRLGDPLLHLADQIDRMDDKVTNGMLLIGGLVAFFNPVIRELEVSLNTAESDHDPLLSFEFEEVTFDGRPDRHLLRLTCQAIAKQYDAALSDQPTAQACGLRDKELRWLDLVREVAKH